MTSLVESNAETAAEEAVESTPLFRDTIEAFTIAVIFALIIKQFAAEAYKVPTGSMEPTIHGDEYHGDRILINKLVGLTRGPRRWEIWVFHYPNNQRINYIKRVVGLPGECLWILNGDIYTSPLGTDADSHKELYRSGDLQICRKPRLLQNDIFDRYPLVRESAVQNISQESFQEFWLIPRDGLPEQDRWRFEDGAVIVASPVESQCEYRRAIKDQRDAFAEIDPTNARGEFHVGDLRMRLRARPLEVGGFVLFTIDDPHHSRELSARIPVEGEERDGWLMAEGEEPASLGDYRLPKGEWTEITFTNVDDRLSLHIGSREVGTVEYQHDPIYHIKKYGIDCKARFGVGAAEIAFDRVAVHRDLYYRNGSFRSTDITEDNYFVLGDNSASSKDSREWMRVTIHPPAMDGRELFGDSEAIPDPRDLNTRNYNPWTEADGEHTTRSFFMDQFGNTHDLGTIDYPAGPNRREASPLVPGKLFVGRAFGVFLPLERIKIVR